MTEKKEYFLLVVRRILSNWTALKLAVEHGMGPKENAENLCLYMMEMMFMNENPDSSDIAAELDDYMDAEFNTELEDDSSIEVAKELLRFYHYCVEENETAMRAEFEKLPQIQPWLLQKESTRKFIHDSALQVDHSSSDNSENENNMDLDSEWTEVKTRRKK
ncbi:uncharacterized protein LOC105698167 [Orussus abietinus]|uniref:uncharacterized protein LOC105698167 n=1 Tax=Orussus abietinus TaxID=222816 RepID=UPI0006266538|nr:uncharacterized protein LOC105698167 [Orussus abietinus]